MKNKKMKKVGLFSMSMLPLAFVAPTVITSCSSLPTGEINKEQQSELLSSDAAKIVVLDNWLSTTYASLFAINHKPDASGIDQQKIENTIRYYLDYLSWPTTQTGNLVGSSNEVEFADETLLSSTDKANFEKSFKDAYKFYISFKSTIKESDSTTSPATYFKVKSFEWKKSEYKTIVEIKSSTDSSKVINISDFNPSLNYTGVQQDGNVIEDDFKILISTRGTKVFQEVMKLLLSEMYFLNATKQQIQNGTNFNKMISNQNSVNYINTMAYVGANDDFSTFLLKKYMVENTPEFKWSYTSEDYKSSVNSSGLVSTILEFNNLKTTKETHLSSTIAPNSTETTNNSITNIQAFDSMTIGSSSSDSSSDSSSTDLNGDLVKEVESLKLFGDTKNGLLDTKTNLMFSFSNLEAIKKAREYNKTNKDALMIPSIVIKTSSNSKKSHSIELGDLDISWNGKTSTSIEQNTFNFVSGNVTQKIIINSIGFKPSKTDTKDINISFTYQFSTDNNTWYSFNHNFQLSNWGESESDQVNPFAKTYFFSGNLEQVGINIFDDSGAATGITYYLRTLPIFQKESTKQIGENWYMIGKWSFDQTPWKSVEEQKKLIYFFMLSDSTLYTSIQDFYLFNNYNYEGNVYELSSAISSLGLTKKTDNDRRDQGII